MNDIEKRRRIIYCPQCESDMLNLYDLIHHVKFETCGMTLERLVAIGVLDPDEIEEAQTTT